MNENKLIKLANESFRKKTDIVISNEGNFGDALKTTFSNYRWLFNKITNSEKEYETKIKNMKSYIDNSGYFNTDYIIPIEENIKIVTSKNVIKLLQELLDKYKKCNLKDNLNLIEKELENLTTHIKSVWVYNNTDDMKKIDTIKENIYNAFIKMLNGEPLKYSNLNNVTEFIIGFDKSHKIIYDVSISKNLENYINHGNIKFKKIERISKVTFEECENSDKNKIKQILLELVDILETGLFSLIALTRKAEKMLGTMTLQFIRPTGNVAYDTKAASNTFDVVSDIRKYLDYLFSDMEKIIKSSASYINQ